MIYMRLFRLIMLLMIAAHVSHALAGDSRDAAPVVSLKFQVHNKSVCEIDRRLFGQFLERPSWGKETGPESAVINDKGDLQPEVLEILKEMRIPIIRFPGGTDVDYMDWCDMVDNVPGRTGQRPVSTGNTGAKVTNRFGLDEYLRLAEKMGWESILVVNLREGVHGPKPLKEAAMHAAGLVAYCNAPVGARLPDGMPDWPAVRARNGRTKPYGIKYYQIGNETWVWGKEERAKDPEKYDIKFVDGVEAYAKAIHAVDPSVEIMMDLQKKNYERISGRLGKKITWFCMHAYMPWECDPIEKNGRAVTADTLTAEEIWTTWVSTPGFNKDGLSIMDSKKAEEAARAGYKVAVTEWNWNGGWWKGKSKGALDSDLARGIGAAGYLHAFMRSGNVIKIATQSMLVGNGWNIAAIKVDPEGKNPPQKRFSGMVTALYGNHHGDKLMEMKSEDVPVYEQPFKMGKIPASPRVAMVDALATAGDRAVYWHAINRSMDKAFAVTVDFSSLGTLAGNGRLYILEGRIENIPSGNEAPAWVREEKVVCNGASATFKLPPHCVAVFEAERK